MYCKICGNSLKESALKCDVCGGPIPAEQGVRTDEEIVYNFEKSLPEKRPNITDEKEAAKPVKEINYVWTPDDTEDFGFVSRPKSLSSEFNSTDKQNAKMSDDEFSWNIHDFRKQAAPVKPVVPEEFIWDTKKEKFELPKGLAPEEKTLDHEIDKFFTFSQKSEEFQKLLDQEYEKISKNSTYPKHEATSEPKKEQILNAEEPSKEIMEDDSKDFVTKTDASAVAFAAVTTAIPDVSVGAAAVGATIQQKPPAVHMAAARDKFDTTQSSKFSSFKDSNYDGGQINNHSIADDDDDDEDDDDRRGWGIGKTLIAIVIVIIVLELALLGIKYFLPNSEAATIITDFQNNISEDIGNLFTSISGPGTEEPIETEEPPVTDPEPEPPAVTPDPLPMTDKDALVASQLSVNTNIKQVKANPTFAFNDKITYKTTDINESKVLENNILFTSAAGTTTYVDRSIVAAVIAFDSKWIDYVNTGDKAILDLVKMDSQAYKNVVNFDKVGKIQEDFLLLEIGEIRVGEKSYYLWTHERIQVVESGKTTTKDYKWIYQLEPVDNVMKIVNYYRY